MNKFMLLMFLLIGTYAFSQDQNLANFNNETEFTIDGQVLYMFKGENNDMTEDNSPMLVEFSKGKFNIIGYDFNVVDYDFYTEDDGEKVLEIIGALPDAEDVEVYLYFSYESNDGMFFIGDEENTSFFFTY